MASNIHYRETLRNAMLDAIDGIIGASGYLRIYDGTQPTNADTAIDAQNQLAQLALSATAMDAAADGEIDAASISDDEDADDTGTATWASLTTSAGVRVIDLSVGTADADLVLNSVAIAAGATVSVTSLTLGLAA